MLIASQFMAALFALAIGGATGITLGYQNGAIRLLERGQTIAASSGSVMIVLDVALWLGALGSLGWFIKAWLSVIHKKPTENRIKKELESIVNHRRSARVSGENKGSSS